MNGALASALCFFALSISVGCSAGAHRIKSPIQSALDPPPAATIARSSSSREKKPPSISPVEALKSESDHAIVALAQGADGCDFDSTRGFVSECDGVDKWQAESELFAEGRGDKALTWILEHGSEKERALAAQKLVAEGASFQVDPSLAERVIAVGAREESDAVGSELGHAIAAIDLHATGDEPKVLNLLEKPINHSLLVSILEELTTHSDPTPGIDAMLVRFTSDPRLEVRQAALLGLALSGDAVACPQWQKALDDIDPSVGLTAAHVVTTGKRCDDLVDPLLSFVGKGQRRGLFTDRVVATTLAELCEFEGASKAQRGLAAALAEGFATPDLPVSLREEALRAALSCSPDERKFVKRFTSDSDEWVRRMAKDLLKAKHHSKAKAVH